MKVVLFCGGLGTRLREHSDTIPKPLVSVGVRPIIWHLMRYYAHYGHTDFVLALGYRGDLIREYFLNYDECLSNDFTLTGNGDSRRIELHTSDTKDWRITFVDTGLHSNLGERLLRVRKFVENEPMFLANYSDGLSDLPLDRLVAELESRPSAVATFAAVRSWHSFHTVEANDDSVVTHIGPMRGDELLINGGYFAFRSTIFDYVNAGEELVEQPFQRLIEKQKLLTYRYSGFWQAMDTFKDKITFDRMAAKGSCPWMVWRPNPAD
jgi:glucose-1-phosphate cytidylyltransferase